MTAPSQRFDVRRAQMPRIPFEQRRYGAAFQQVQLLEDTLRFAARPSDESAGQLAAC